MTRALHGLVLLGLGVVLSCQAPPREPRAVQPESDVCIECRMTVVSEGHAAQAIDREGLIMMFDDPGCLAVYYHDHPLEREETLLFVQDVETKQWVAWESAVFVRADAVATPMNYGWHAFGDHGRAEAFAQDHQGHLLDAGSPGTLAALALDLEPRRWRP